MSLLDKVVEAVTPQEDEKQRQDARAKARAAAGPNDWLSLVLQQHLRLESAFGAVKSARDSGARVAALKQLGILLTGHANAEESVIYPALVQIGEKGQATEGYSEQADAKISMAALERLSPMSQEFLDKLEHIREAVRHHMYEEEGKRFLDLKKQLPAAEQAQLTQRFREEFERYVGSDMAAEASAPLSIGQGASAAAPLQPH